MHAFVLLLLACWAIEALAKGEPIPGLLLLAGAWALELLDLTQEEP